MRNLLYKALLLTNKLVVHNRFMYNLALNIYRSTLKPILLYKDKKTLFEYGPYILSALHQFFEKNRIEYIVAFGTLLGFIRDKNFISHDTDIDLIIIDPPEITFPNEFKKTKEIYVDNKLAQVGLEFKGLNIDVFIAQRNKQEIICYDFPNYPGMNWYETIIKLGGVPVRQFIFPYSQRILYEIEINNFNLKVYVPKEWKEHLEIVYGKNYLHPNPNWDALNIRHPNVKILEDKLAKVIFL